MKILQISQNDYGGCAYYLAEAIGETTRHKSLSARAGPGSYIGYKAHLAAPLPDDLLGVWDWADVVHVHDILPKLPRGAPKKPVVVTYHGSMFRRAPKVYLNQVAREGWIGTVATPDLARFGLPWLPDCRPDLSAYVSRCRDVFVVAHAPTSRVVKDTDAVEAALRGVEGVELDVIEGTGYEDCLGRKGRAGAVVDQFRLGYGLNAIEAWAMRLPVVGNAEDEHLKAVLAQVGEAPFVRCEAEPGAIRECVLRLRDDVAFHAAGVARGRRCYERFHSPEVAARNALALYHRAMEAGGWKPSAEVTAQGEERWIDVRALPTHEPLVEYTGKNSSMQTIRGDATGKRYEYGGERRRFYVDPRDLAAILKARDKGRRPCFRQVGGKK